MIDGRIHLYFSPRRAAHAAVFFLVMLMGFACCGVCPTSTQAPPPTEAKSASSPPTVTLDPTVIPRHVLFGNPDRAATRISPDGTRISFLAPVDGVLNVFVGPVDDPAAAEPVTRDTGRGIRIYFWVYTNRHIVYLQDTEGDENWRVHVVDLETQKTTDLTPLKGVHATIEAVSHKLPEEILVGLNDRKPELHDIYRVNLTTGERTLIQENPGFAGFFADDDYKIRFAMQMTEDGGTAIYKPQSSDPQKTKKKNRKKKGKNKPQKGEKKSDKQPEEGDPLAGWEPFMTIGMEDSLTTTPIDFNKTGDVLYMLDSRNRDTAAFAELNLKTSELAVKAEDPRADLQDLMIHPTEKNVEAVAFTYVRKEWRILDPALEPHFEFLDALAEGDFEITSRTLADDKWIVAYLLDDGPVSYYLYDKVAQKARFLFTNRKALEALNLSPMHGVVIPSRDGKNLVSYLTLPKALDPDNDGHPDTPIPMVLDVHGGPWARDEWGFNASHQWLANRGYAVLSVNFRGSTGFGKSFINAGNMEWAGKMHDDLIDAVNWAVAEKIADPKKVAIMGGSYGGYATLVGLTFTPKTFACGVDIVGPSNLVTLLNTIPPYWTPMIALFTKRVGDHRTKEGKAFLKSRSPLTFADKIERPLLIAQGANDPRVKRSESDQITKAMNDKGIPITYVLYPDEGHGFARPENRQSFYAVTELFLSECLGGKKEPIGEDFNGATITVPVGVEHVPGLKEALFQPK
jgi:dipeptidyl aminopeptidase/acylaminoacyl peptidase